MKYTIIIQWSDEDNCFVVFLPEFEDVMQPVTHIESALNNNEPLPNSQLFSQSLQLSIII